MQQEEVLKRKLSYIIDLWLSRGVEPSISKLCGWENKVPADKIE